MTAECPRGRESGPVECAERVKQEIPSSVKVVHTGPTNPAVALVAGWQMTHHIDVPTAVAYPGPLMDVLF